MARAAATGVARLRAMATSGLGIVHMAKKIGQVTMKLILRGSSHRPVFFLKAALGTEF